MESEAELESITLENLAAKLGSPISTSSSTSTSSSSQVYAMVDMGSNGIRFSVSDLSGPQARLLPCVYAERAGLSLFDALDSSGGFPLATVSAVARTVARFVRIAVDEYGVRRDKVMVFATEAVRRAANGRALGRAIRGSSGVELQVLTPEVETLFGAAGARSGFLHVRGLFLDLGGGSVQMTYMDSRADDYEMAAARAGRSLPFGAARLTRLLEAEASSAEAERMALHAGMRAAFESLHARFPSLAASVAGEGEGESEGEGNDGVDVYLCGGGFRGYGSILMHTDPTQPYPIPGVGTYAVAGARFARTKELLAVNRDHKGRIFGMSSRRRAQFPAVAAVVDALVAAVPRIRRAVFCAGGTREGALFLGLPRTVREANPLALVGVDVGVGVGVGVGAGSWRQVGEAVLDTLRSALPHHVQDLQAASMAPALQLLRADDVGGVFAPAVWRDTGEADADNASAALRRACTDRPGCPGLTHVGRAVLGLALCARWGGGAALPPVDEPLYRGLRGIVAAEAGQDAVFWIEYVGATAAALARVAVAWPRDEDKLRGGVRFRAQAERAAETLLVQLDMFVDAVWAEGILADMSSVFKTVNKGHKNKKVTVTVHAM